MSAAPQKAKPGAEKIDVTVSAAVYTSSCLRMLTGKRDGVLPV